MKIYFELGNDELNEPTPPMAITVAKALIEISMDGISDFGGDIQGPFDWLDEIGEHLRAYTRTMRGHAIRMDRNNRERERRLTND